VGRVHDVRGHWIAAGNPEGADDGHGGWSEYRITADPAGTVELPALTNTSGQAFISTAVALSALRAWYRRRAG
jgi:hypothetical protein